MHCLTSHRSILIHDTNSMTYQFDLEMNQQNYFRSKFLSFVSAENNHPLCIPFQIQIKFTN